MKLSPLCSIVAAGVAAWGAGASAQEEPASGEAAVSTVSEVPDNANIVQEEAADGGDSTLQMRWRSLADGDKSDNRGAVQSFRWDAAAPMTGIGLGVSTEQGDLDPLPGPQAYRLDLHEVDPTTQKTASKQRLAGFSVELTPDQLTGSEERTYLYLSFPEPVALKEGQTYAVHLRPAAEGEDGAGDLALHRVFLLRSSEEDPYSAGIGNQTDASPREDGDPFGSRRYDLVFFTTAGAEEPE